MTGYATQLAQVCHLLNEEGARYVLVGASALQLWGSTRTTRDIDILIEPTVENAERVLRALSQLGFGMAREWLAKDVASHPVTIIGEMPKVDILTVAWSVKYRQAAPAAQIFEVERVKIPTASIDHLIASKRTGRLQDAADIEVLEEIKRLRGAVTRRAPRRGRP
jgi:predicted nucleotidyltransferase